MFSYYRFLLKKSNWFCEGVSATIGGGFLGRDKHSRFRKVLGLLESRCIKFLNISFPHFLLFRSRFTAETIVSSSGFLSLTLFTGLLPSVIMSITKQNESMM